MEPVGKENLGNIKRCVAQHNGKQAPAAPEADFFGRRNGGFRIGAFFHNLQKFRAQKKHASEISINETIDVDRDGNPLSYMDVISSDEDLSEEVDRKIMTARALTCIKTALSLRERQIIVMRYGLFGTNELTQREIAEKLGISRSYVSRIEKSALEKLKSALGS